ncbi:tyrosine-type recombinase/integrase [Streptomyces sp. Midd1]|uniref:tyrosine-type recombinase/integrase n=1 Tax=Streptomyces sp. Midd3 TaxID=3161191 RepID=UPI0034DAD5FF
MARRNSNGEGSVYQRKSDKRWVSSIWVETASGKSKRVYVYGKTRAEVHTKLTELKTKKDRGISTADKNWLLGDYLDHWLTEVIKPNQKPTTYDLYESNVRLYLKPDLGKMPLVKLTVPSLQRYLNHQLETGHSVRKVQTLREVVSSALTRAMREEVLTRNVAKLVEVRSVQGRGKHFEPWTPAEARQFLEVALQHQWFPAFLISVLYGMRRGEVLGLRWRDIDFVNMELHIDQQVFRAGGIVQIGPVKTKAGERDLPLLEVVGQLLLRWKKQNGSALDDGLAFTTSTGQPIEPQNYTRAFQRLCARYQIRRIRLHDLRHGVATLLKDLGVPDKDVQLIMGHSNISITQKIYQHAGMDSRRTALNQVGDALLSSEVLISMADDSKSLSPAVRTDGNESSVVSRGSCQNGCQTPATPSLTRHFKSGSQGKSKPATGVTVAGLLDDFLGDLTGNRTRIARMKTRNTPGLGGMQQRATEVDEILQARRRTWLLGVVAVSAAVKDTRGEEPDLAA